MRKNPFTTAPAKKSEADRSAQRKNAAEIRPKSVLEAFEQIVELASESDLNEEFFTLAANHIRYASRKLKLSSMQTALLAIFVDRSEDQRIMLSEIASFAGCRTTRMLRLSADIDILEQRHYVRASRSGNSLSYRVPVKVLEALRANKPYVHEVQPVNDLQDFFDRFRVIMRDKRNNELDHDSLKRFTLELLEQIADTPYARGLKGASLDDDDKLLFTFIAHLYVENNDDNIVFSDIENIFDEDEMPWWCRRELRQRDSDLFKYQLIENVNEDGMARADAFRLTDKAKEELLGELSAINVGRSKKGLVDHDSLVEKHLIYNPTEREQVAQLCDLLGQERFTGVQERLRKAGMRPGFCCIFYGAPGTGKTETVYQLARLTGRDILRVDVDKIKSCWVGESEKNVKQLFDRYRAICANSPVAPILLFNEADAVLGVRREGASSAVDKMENSLQNIILQEMESLDGIMIATTNLTCNLDRAFERRFLYKIRFDKPTVEARTAIWRTMLPTLAEADAADLAGQFDLSGGEIENIARKHSVECILSGKESLDKERLIDICRHERLSSTSRNPIGF